MPSAEQILKTEANNLGFLLSGITTPEPPTHFHAFENWLKQGFNANMAYLSRPDTLAKRENPVLLFEDVKSILVLGIPYQPVKRMDVTQIQNPGISAYALGPDYHELIPAKIQTLMENFQTRTGIHVNWKAFTDSAPILEHDLANRAGLGWTGKNALLLNRTLGSYFFLAEVFLSIELNPDQAEVNDCCGTCTRCITACPTQAILTNRTIDANRCLSYLTIENKGTIPEEFRDQVYESAFGCDICQQVCPWNQKLFTKARPVSLFEPDETLSNLNVEQELKLTAQDFNKKYKTSPIKRTKRRGYLRNLCLWAGNSGNIQLLPALQTLLSLETDPLILEHCQWAIHKLETL